MKPLKLFAVAVALAIVAWTGVALYWQVRISRALRTFETTEYFSQSGCYFGTPPYQQASHELIDAGVRALPALVRSVTPDKPAPYLTESTVLIRKILSYRSKSWREEWKAWVIEIESEPPERELKCRLLRDWWEEHGDEFMSPWRPWDRGYCLVP
jgi:hypothetical protein